MTDKALAELIDRLPKPQREQGRKRVVHALKLGWSHLDLFGEGRFDVADLVGVSPGGLFDFLSEHFSD